MTPQPYFLAILSLCFLSGGSAKPPAAATSQEVETPEKLQTSTDAKNDPIASFKTAWERDFKIRPGMTVDELKKYIDENNAKVQKAKPPKWETRRFHKPAFAYKELRLHVFLSMNPNSDQKTGETPKALTYLVNGRTQFWMDLGIENDRIKNIYISFGNLSYVLPPFRLAGKGPHVSAFFQREPDEVAEPTDEREPD